MNLTVADAKREEGFTLIELLVVVIIIGILAAIAIPVFLNQRQRAWERTSESDVRNAAIAVETVFTDDFEYPVGPTSMGPGPAVVPLEDGDGAIDGENVTVSPLVTLSYALNDQTFCISAVHANINEGNDVVATYNSAEGGLQDTLEDAATACA